MTSRPNSGGSSISPTYGIRDQVGSFFLAVGLGILFLAPLVLLAFIGIAALQGDFVSTIGTGPEATCLIILSIIGFVTSILSIIHVIGQLMSDEVHGRFFPLKRLILQYWALLGSLFILSSGGMGLF